MALSIGTNNSALQAAAAASSVNRNMETCMERLCLAPSDWSKTIFSACGPVSL